jgi:hypothetical protein
MFDDRAHPGPLPQGEGESFAVNWRDGRVFLQTRGEANFREAAATSEANKVLRNFTLLSLSTGERAGVGERFN